MKRQALQSERVAVPGLSRNEPQVIRLGTTIEKEVKSNRITLKIAAKEKKK